MGELTPPVLTPDDFLDIRAEVCPMTYVRTKLKLEELAPGSLLEIWLQGEEPLRNVPRSALDEGHEVVSMEAAPLGGFRLLLRKDSRGS